jgi:hypothetical protein
LSPLFATEQRRFFHENAYIGVLIVLPTKIKCKQMETWDFEHCMECKRFRLNRGKGLKNWRCSLNSDSAEERRDFSMIWATLYLQNVGYDLTIPKVEIIYVGKRKRKARSNNG